MRGMIDAKALLDRFLSPGAAVPLGTPAAPTQGGLGETARATLGRMGGAGGLVGAAAVGGLLGALTGGKKRKGGGMLSHGGAALLGALAERAWQNWQAGQPPAAAPVAGPADAAAVEPRFLPAATPAAGGEPFELALVRAMIGAAAADGHIDAAERARIFDHVEKAGLDAEAKAFVFEALDRGASVAEVAAAAATPEQAAEIYLVSRLAMEPDTPAERAYLAALAHRLRLEPDLVAHLDRQVAGVPAPAEGARRKPARPRRVAAHGTRIYSGGAQLTR